MNPLLLFFAFFGSAAGLTDYIGRMNGKKPTPAVDDNVVDDIDALIVDQLDAASKKDAEDSHPITGAKAAPPNTSASKASQDTDTAAQPPKQTPVQAPQASKSTAAPKPTSPANDAQKQENPPAADPVIKTTELSVPSAPPAPNNTDPIDLESSNGATVDAGQVTKLSLGEDVAGIEILDRPDVGNLTVNPDNTLALVLTGETYEGPLSFSAKVTYTDNTTDVITKNLSVGPLLQQKGWATGEKLYMLETDSAGELIVEHGDNHRLVHVSNSEDALSLADVAALEGLDKSKITGAWLANNPDYGADPSMALDETAGMALWKELTGKDAEPSSHWLLFERGHEYKVGRLIEEGTQGESELHPIYVGAYGSGDAPRMLDDIRVFQAPSSNIVFNEIEAAGDIGIIGGGKNIIFDSITSEGEISVNFFAGLTIRDSAVYDVRYDAPVDGSDIWLAGPNRISGTFATKVKGLLMEGNLYDHNGWAPDYDFGRSAEYGQPSSMYSHNIYLQHNNQDVTLRDNIIMRGASYGAQVRSGGFIEDNVFLDNNAAVNFLGGRPDNSTANPDDKTGNFTLFADNLVTSGASKQASQAEGTLARGIDAYTRDSSLVDNIVTHLANPDDPAELAASKQNGGGAVRLDKTIAYNDTIVYNWVAGNELSGDVRPRSPDENTEGLNKNTLDQTTIQRFTADLLGKPDATIDDLGQFLRAEMANGTLSPTEADDIIGYFQKSFGIAPDVRTSAETLRFVPNELGDGVRWDNRLNWDTEDLPGQIAGDSVDLAGNWVTYGARTSTIKDLDFGSGGRLSVTSGKLSVDGAISVGPDDAEVTVSKAGQLWIDGYSDKDLLNIDVTGGRFANMGDFAGTTDLDVSGGQALLATAGADMSLDAGSRLTVDGSDAKLGFDGRDNDVATLQVGEDARIDFQADSDGFSKISEFRSGHYDVDAPKVLSGIDLGGGVLGIDLTGHSGHALDAVLFQADEIVGSFDAIEIIGLGDKQDAKITFDYNTDKVSFQVTSPTGGSGATKVDFIGDMMNAKGNNALWAALTDGKGTYDDTLPPEVTEVDEFSAVMA